MSKKGKIIFIYTEWPWNEIMCFLVPLKNNCNIKTNGNNKTFINVEWIQCFGKLFNMQLELFKTCQVCFSILVSGNLKYLNVLKYLTSHDLHLAYLAFSTFFAYQSMITLV